MEDIVIIVNSRNEKAIIAGLTRRGLNWLITNMDSSFDKTVSAEGVEEIAKLMRADGLTIVVR